MLLNEHNVQKCQLMQLLLHHDLIHQHHEGHYHSVVEPMLAVAVVLMAHQEERAVHWKGGFV